MSWQYIAGYVDGEGSLLLGVTRDKRTDYVGLTDNWYLVPALCIQSYDHATLQRIRDFIHTEGVAHCFKDMRKARYSQTDYSTRIQVGGYKNMKLFLEKIYPYSIAKKPQYDLFFKMLDIILSRPTIQKPKSPTSHARWTKENWLKVMCLVDQLNALKKGKRGRSWYPYFCELWKMKT